MRFFIAVLCALLAYSPARAQTAQARIVDASKDNVVLETLAKKGDTTLVMVSSPGCPDCMAEKPGVMSLAGHVKNLTVVIVDIGLTSAKRINWSAPVMRANGLHSLPFYFIFDADGKVKTTGEAAADQVQDWVGSIKK
jgi:hypothetical protein